MADFTIEAELADEITLDSHILVADGATGTMKKAPLSAIQEVVDTGGSGGMEPPTSIAYTTAIPFTNGNTIIAAHTVTANTVLTKVTSGAVAGFGATLRLTADGTHTVDLSAFKLIGTGDWVNTASTVNLLLFMYDGTDYCVCISQPTAIAAPGGAITLNAPTSFAAGTPTVDGCPFTFDDTNTSPAEDSGLIEIAEVADTTYSAVVGTRTPGANATSALPGSDLTAGTDYRARMKFVGNGTTTLDSPWSAEVTFTTAASDVVAPTVTFEATSATNIRGTFSEAMGTVTVAGWDFDNGSPITPSAVALSSGNIYDFTVAGLTSADTITASYNTTTGATTDVAGNEVATITAQSVTNSVPPAASWANITPYASSNLTESPATQWNAAGGIGTLLSNEQSGATDVCGARCTWHTGNETVVGLTGLTTGAGYNNMSHAAYISAGLFFVFQNGGQITGPGASGSFATMADGDVPSVEKVDGVLGTIKYFLNGVELYESLITSTIAQRASFQCDNGDSIYDPEQMGMV